MPVVVNGNRHTMRIVGAAVFASFSRGGFSATDLGNGAAVPASVLSVPFPAGGCTGNTTCYNFILLRYKPGTNLRAAAAHLGARITASGCPPGFCLVSADQRPSDIRDYTGVRDTPLVLAVALALLATPQEFESPILRHADLQKHCSSPPTARRSEFPPVSFAVSVLRAGRRLRRLNAALFCQVTGMPDGQEQRGARRQSVRPSRSGLAGTVRDRTDTRQLQSASH